MTLQQIDPADLRVVPEWELCDRLRRSMRLVPGMSNSDVAELMGVRREAISAWLNGRNRPSYAVLRVWSDMTGCDLNWLVNGQPSAEWYAIRDSNPEPADWEPRPVLRLVHGPRIPNPRPVGAPGQRVGALSVLSSRPAGRALLPVQVGVRARLTLIGGAA